jgi:molybdopterin-guanine dinucleotide biosynthesis protein MobB
MDLNLPNARVPVLGFTAPSGTGKTTLLCRVLTLLRARGLRVGVVKQARDDFQVDVPGKDSFELRKAGLERLLLGSAAQTALICEHPSGGEPRLDSLLPLFDQDRLDLILAEGFAEEPFPKLELIREGCGEPRYPGDPWIIALVTNRAGALQAPIPQLDMDDPIEIAEFVLTYREAFGKRKTPERP